LETNSTFILHGIGAKTEMTQATYDEEKLRAIYQKVIEEPNKNVAKKGFIRCPECGEEILMIPTLKVMNEAIENHVRKHKEQLIEHPIKEHQTAIFIRLSLMEQVLQYACKPQVS
jgi:hypothetical protein